MQFSSCGSFEGLPADCQQFCQAHQRHQHYARQQSGIRKKANHCGHTHDITVMMNLQGADSICWMICI